MGNYKERKCSLCDEKHYGKGYCREHYHQIVWKKLKKKWDEKNPDYYRNWRKKHPDYYKKSSKKWRENNPDKIKLYEKTKRKMSKKNLNYRGANKKYGRIKIINSK